MHAWSLTQRFAALRVLRGTRVANAMDRYRTWTPRLSFPFAIYYRVSAALLPALQESTWNCYRSGSRPRAQISHT